MSLMTETVYIKILFDPYLFIKCYFSSLYRCLSLFRFYCSHSSSCVIYIYVVSIDVLPYLIHFMFCFTFQFLGF